MRAAQCLFRHSHSSSRALARARAPVAAAFPLLPLLALRGSRAACVPAIGDQLRWHGRVMRPIFSVGRSRKNVRRGARAADGTRIGAQDGEAEERGFDRRYTTQKDLDRLGRDRMPRDFEITDPRVMVIDGGPAEGPLVTRYVLSKLEPYESLRMVRPYVPSPDGDETRDITSRLTLCKIVNKRVELKREETIRKEKRRELERKRIKVMELSWGIGSNDLKTKMRQLRRFVWSGSRVEAVLGQKRSGRVPMPGEAEKVVEAVRSAIQAGGGREERPAQGEVGKTMRLFFVPKKDAEKGGGKEGKGKKGEGEEGVGEEGEGEEGEGEEGEGEEGEAGEGKEQQDGDGEAPGRV